MGGVLTLRLWYYIVGFLHIRVIGDGLEHFTNLSMMRGVVMWDIHRQDDALTAKVGLSSFAGIWPLASRSGCRLRILGKQGLPFLWRNLKKRPVLLASFVIMMLMVVALSRYVWFVDVSGVGPVQRAAILRTVQRAGLEPGVLKRGLDTRTIERYVLLNMPDMVWVAVRVEGLRAVVEVASRQHSWEIDSGLSGDIVAAKHGVITKLLVLAGEALVNEGDTVWSGQVLIQAPASEDGPGQARGEVRARTWYQAYGETPLKQSRLYATGRTYVREVLRWGDHELVWKGREQVPFQEYETYTNQRTLSFWRNIVLPVELITHTYRESEWVEFSFSVDEARSQAALNAQVAAKSRIPPDAELGEVMLEVVEGTEAIGVRAIIETIEEIGRFQPLGVEVSVTRGATTSGH